ncbi:DUF2273 domain-containing protein [Lactobacillus sp. CC-MHH1034]|uniref:DUF2273 domain-containing protein n=1 Tax=Agrilactobacillus fermenti TaxID=2586909 RepID=UPI001E3462EB|nr:DUF2273 domain-containing protein [Agrilactobacillus fermenti]MCD2255637.1 DUF2273 domain-containing protein [Agrilactobacillus fermenti]
MSKTMMGLVMGAIAGLILVTLGFWKMFAVALFALIGFAIAKFVDFSGAKSWLGEVLNRDS